MCMTLMVCDLDRLAHILSNVFFLRLQTFDNSTASEESTGFLIVLYSVDHLRLGFKFV